MRTRVPIAITAFVGVFMMLKYFFAHPLILGIANELEQWGVVTLAFAIILGVLNLARINLKAVLERKKDWGYKLILIVSMFFMMIACGVKWYRDVQAGTAARLVEEVTTNPGKLSPQTSLESLQTARDAAEQGARNTVFQFAFDQIYNPLSATIYALLAFYVASAAFRAFRARNWQSGVLLVTAILVMVGRVPIGGAIWDGFPYIQQWLMVWPNTAGQRAILMGAALGMIATGIRVIFGIERPYLKG
jgi:hypothetical protein